MNLEVIGNTLPKGAPRVYWLAKRRGDFMTQRVLATELSCM
jgi:hypothetical protein